MPGGRVLMIAHHFPPAGGSGANRALAFARYLPEHGWTPVVLTPGAEWAMNRDDGQLAGLPAGLRVVRTRSFEARPQTSSVGAPSASRDEIDISSPEAGARRRRRRDGDLPEGGLSTRRPSALRGQLGHLKRFPDAHLGWLPFALAATRRERFDLIYSSSGPFTSHLVGVLLKRLTHTPWIAELRDGWYRWNRAIFPDYPAWRDVLERRLEAAAIRSADRVILVTERMAQAFRCQYRELPADHFGVVPNGFDPVQIEHVERAAGIGWEVLHAGALYYGRSLAAFLDAVQRVANADAEFAREFRLTLIGTLDASARAELERSGLQDRVQVRGQLDHRATLAAMASAHALLLVANTTPGAEATVPGKLFEYLAVGQPVFAIAPPDSSTADVLRQTGGGWLAPADDAAAIACTLRRAYAERSSAAAADPAAVARFDRRLLTSDLATVFDGVLAHARRP